MFQPIVVDFTYIVTYMLKLHIRYTYVLNQPCGFAYMSHIYVTYMWTNETYVTYTSHICRFGKGNGSLHVTHYRCSKLFITKQSAL